MTLHLSNIYAKRAQAGPLALQEATDVGIKACVGACRPSLDIVCGDINMACCRQKGDSALWRDTAYDVLELRGIIPVSDWQGECCFAGVRETWVQQLLVNGSSWGQQLDGKPTEEQQDIYRNLLEQRGAKKTIAGLSVSFEILLHQC